jgi:hypothetical protein
MGLIYLPFETIPAVSVGGVRIPAPREVLIETVSAQTGFIIIQLGIGAILGGELNGLLEWLYTTGGEVDYRLFWYTCAGIAGACGLAIALAFRDQAAVPEPEPEPAVEEAETTVGPDEPA